MSTPSDEQDRPAPREPYSTPRLEPLGAVVEVTQRRSMMGRMDGGNGMNNRTG